MTLLERFVAFTKHWEVGEGIEARRVTHEEVASIERFLGPRAGHSDCRPRGPT